MQVKAVGVLLEDRGDGFAGGAGGFGGVGDDAVGCGLLVPVFQERGTGLFRVVGTGPGQASSMRCPTRTKCCALTRRGLLGR